MQALADQLERLVTTQGKMNAVASFIRDASSRGGHYNVVLKPGGQPEDDHLQDDEYNRDSESLATLLKHHGLADAFLQSVVENKHSLAIGADEILERLPCANVQPEKDWRCTGDGIQACSVCRLVSYCSKVSGSCF
jgi:hypothetical protein